VRKTGERIACRDSAVTAVRRPFRAGTRASDWEEPNVVAPLIFLEDDLKHDTVEQIHQPSDTSEVPLPRDPVEEMLQFHSAVTLAPLVLPGAKPEVRWVRPVLLLAALLLTLAAWLRQAGLI
jgi:hypothetical protein